MSSSPTDSGELTNKGDSITELLAFISLLEMK
jgi:hypothetical protein